MKTKIILLIAFVFSYSASAQKWTNYITANTSSKLCNDYVNGVASDLDGSLWFATNCGVSRFDGDTTWVNYDKEDGLSNNKVNTIFIDTKGNKWLGTEGGGVSYFNGSQWTTYDTISGLIDNNVHAVAQDNQGNMLFGTDKGVSKFDGVHWTSFSATNNKEVISIAVDLENNLWFGTQGWGVLKFDGNNWTAYSTQNSLSGYRVYDIAVDANNNKWFGTESGVSKFDGTNWTSYYNANGLVNNVVNSILIDSLNNIWFGTAGGVSKFDGSNWTAYTETDGLINNYVKAIAIDFNGNKWFGSNYYERSGGVSKFDDKNWSTYKSAGGLASNTINAIAIDSKGNKWFEHGSNGISAFDGNHWNAYALDTLYIFSICADKFNNKWLATNKGALKYDGTTWTQYTKIDGLADNNVNDVFIDTQNNKWFATGNGLSKFDDNSWKTFGHPQYGNISKYVSNRYQIIFIDSKDNKWMYSVPTRADALGGRSDLFCGITKISNEGIFSYYLTDDYYPSYHVYSIDSDTLDNVWFGTDKGAFKFDGTNWTTYTTKEGLISDLIYSVAIDCQGAKWFGTDKGVSKYDGSNWISYTTKDGLVDNKILAIVADSINNKWFGTSAGVSKFEDASLSISEDTLRISANGGSEATFDIISNIKWNISSDQNWLSLSFTSGSNNSKITVTCSANILPSPRSATINITGNGSISKIVTITQASSTTDIVDILNSDFLLYPTPVVDQLHLMFPKKFANSKIVIYSLDGKKVYSFKINNCNIEIDMKPYPPGVYFVRAFSFENIILTKKIIKQ